MAKWAVDKHKRQPQRPIDLVVPERQQSLQEDRCIPAPIGCGGPATTFTSDTSRREYGISGLCQKCQDEVFAPHYSGDGTHRAENCPDPIHCPMAVGEEKPNG